eukprot:CAMPEP_0201112334 /NCGR_PEP_ID=MMETSP0812-20130820/77187_1 /ASSEMBLY_ACC=CAM_ASM_000668 /TAXON_ID=98059 /ORGANISM="Dinobryon sp., Strain UTEXLB2267" /LENGTH=640 /DNA_ID=CAMNT_0047375655 /DNA_START=533 /DNA_END=2455 /DNA_ORIENTATION=-
MVTGIYNLSFWFHVVASQQGRKWIDIKLLSIDEYTCLVHSFALLFYALSITFWHLTHSDTAWKNRKEDALIFQMVTYYLFLLVVTLFPGRIVRMVAMSNMKSLDLKQTFVRHVSHEIRSPLNVVHAGLEILRSELVFSASSAALELIDDIYSASETAIEILNDLLHYEHMDSGTFKLELSWQPLARLWGSKLKWAFILAEKNNISLTVTDSTNATEYGVATLPYRNPPDESNTVRQECCGDLNHFLHIDVFKVDQVVQNLITNALKFTSSGGSVEVKISCQLLDHTNAKSIFSKMGVDAVGVLRVEVTDNGAGIDPADHSKVFGEFSQFNRNELQGGGGSGLGLWISRRIIHMHKGHMGFVSAGRGLGSTFFFELPLLSPTEADISKQNISPPKISLASRVEISAALTLPSNNLADHLDRSDELQITSEKIAIRYPNFISALDEETEKVECVLKVKKENARSDSSRSTNDSSSPRNKFTRKNSPGSGKIVPEEFLQPTETFPTHKTLRILIVDDSAMNRKMLRKLIEIEKEGILAQAHVIEADDGLTAVEALRSAVATGSGFDLILMDYTMLRMHGPDATAIMRKDLQYSGPIIGVTGNALPEDIAKFIASGANSVLTKPLTRAKFLQAIVNSDVNNCFI